MSNPITMLLAFRTAFTPEEELVGEMSEAIEQYVIDGKFDKLLIPAQMLLMKRMVGNDPAKAIEMFEKMVQHENAVNLLKPDPR